MNALTKLFLSSLLVSSALWALDCSRYENVGDCVRTGPEICDGIDNDCDGETDQKHFACSDGSEVEWCSCDSQGNYECIDSPENQCLGDECQAGEQRYHTCPDGSEVPWCTCEDGQWMCIGSPEIQCRDSSCDDGSTPTCELIPPTCEDWEILAYQSDCYRCVNPETCEPWGVPTCESDGDCAASEYCDDCASSSCPMCEDCVAGCLPHACSTEAQATCYMERPECLPGQVSVVRDGCWICVNAETCEEEPMCEPGQEQLYECPDGEMVPWCFCTEEGTWECVGSPELGCRDSSCDDGTEPMCNMMPPECEDWEILAYQDYCYACVNPATCEPWGVPGCTSDMNCGLDEYCNPCASSSCPDCDDCLAGCVPHNCPGDDPVTLMCMAPRHECNEGRTSIIRNGCWVCVELDTCQPPDPCGGVTDLPATCPDFSQVDWCTCTDAGTWDCIEDPHAACRDTHCDDGTVPTCDMMPPICEEGEIMAYVDMCYLCVDPETCEPRG